MEGICFAIPADTARVLVSDLIEYGAVVGRVDLGITVSAATKNDGSSIVYVTEATGAGDGFKLYDKIDSIAGIKISTVLDFNNALATVKPGDEIEVVVYRGSMQQSWLGGNSLSFATDPTTFKITAEQKK